MCGVKILILPLIFICISSVKTLNHEETCPLKKLEDNSTSKNVTRNYDKFCQAPIATIPRHHVRLCIAGGTNAKLTDFPYIAALGFYNPTKNHYQFECGGSIVSPSFILTAAHCIFNAAKYEVKIVRVGSLHVWESDNITKYDVEVEEVKVHPQYDPIQRVHDLALIKTKRSLNFGRGSVRPICLHEEDEVPDGLYVAGWGKLGFERESSTTLQAAPVFPVPMPQCQQKYRKIGITLSPTHICAGNADTNFCRGDSGGPLHVETKLGLRLVGVTSFGQTCGSSYPGIYTRVSKYLDWIESTAWNF